MKQVSFIYAIFFSIFLCYSSFAQKNSVAEDALKKQANEMVTYFEAGNYEAFVKFTYPKIVTMIGGEAKMVNAIKSESAKWKEEGISIQSVSVGDVTKIVKAGNELHSLISQQLIMKVPGGTMTKNSYLLAISVNKGLKWYFLDSSPLTDDKLKRLFPNFNTALEIPAKEDPVFTASE